MTKIVHETQHCNKRKKHGWIRTEKINMSQSEALNARELGFDVKACGLVIESHESWDGFLES